MLDRYRIAYSYHSGTKEYKGEVKAWLSPKESTSENPVYLLPIDSTYVQVPELAPQEIAIWNEYSWDISQALPADNFDIVTSNRICGKVFIQELSSVVSNPQFSVSGGSLGSLEEKTITFKMSATEEHIQAVTSIIGNHNYAVAILQEIRDTRNLKLDACDWIIRRHEDQFRMVEAGLLDHTTITEELFNQWLTYRQLLRDLPSICDPLNPQWPIEPQ